MPARSLPCPGHESAGPGPLQRRHLAKQFSLGFGGIEWKIGFAYGSELSI